MNNLKKQAALEAYNLYKALIDPSIVVTMGANGFPLATKGGAPIGHNDTLDAFRHAYVSGVFTLEYGATITDLLGWGNEIYTDLNSAPLAEKIMDIHNNQVGIETALTVSNRTDLADELVLKLANNELIVTDSHGITNYSDDFVLYAQDGSKLELEIAFGDFTNVMAITFTGLDNIEHTINAEFFNNVYRDGLETILDYLGEDVWQWLANSSAMKLQVNSTIQAAMNFVVAAWVRVGDPLVLDLDNDGFELISSANSGVYFDYNGDSLGEKTGWVGPDDGFLALDANSNGVIDDVSELFGDLNTNGFTELASHDATVNGGNNDGKIDSLDSVWGSLKVWKDANSDGITDTGELQNLAYHGIKQIVLNPTSSSLTVAGNQILHLSTFADNAAVDKKIGEVFFGIDFFDNEMISDVGTVFGTDEELLALPLSRGYGEVVSLQKAMETDSTLRGMVEDLTEYTVTSASADDLLEMVEDIIFRWTGAEGSTEHVYGSFSPEKAKALEVLFALDLDALASAPGAGTDLGIITGNLSRAWDMLFDTLTVRLIFQGPMKFLTPNAYYDVVSDNMNLNDSLANILRAFETHNLKSEGMLELLFDMLNVNGNIDPNVPQINEAYALFGDYDTSWLFPHPDDMFTNLKHYNGTASAETMTGWAGGDVIRGGEGNDTISSVYSNYSTGVVNGSTVYTYYYATNYHHFLYGDGGNDRLTVDYGWAHMFGGTGDDSLSNFSDKESTMHGGTGNDTLIGDSHNDLMFGGDGNDSINGYAGNDQIYGGAGADTLIGGNGNNIIFGGAGNDVISVDSGLSYVDTGSGDNSVATWYTEIELYAYEGNDTVNLDNLIGNSIIDLGEGIATVTRSGSGSPTGTLNLKTGSSADSIAFYASASTVNSGAGNDTITSGSGNDSIVAGDGNDSINAGNGNNTVYGGEGNDWISVGSGSHVIDGGNGNNSIAAEGTVLITAYGGDDTVNLSYLTNSSQIDLGDGVNIVTRSGTGSPSGTLNLTTGSGADSIAFYASASTVNSGAGNDSILAGNGNDSIVAGDGNDSINAAGGNNTVYGGDGDDWISVTTGSHIVDGGNGNNTITADGTLTITTYGGNDTVNLSYLTNSSQVDLGDGANMVTRSGTGSPTGTLSLITGSGADSLTFYASASTVTSGAGNDTIVAGGGSDVLNGEAGADSITGGSGVDYFVFTDLTHSTDTARDIITDFVRGTDKIDLTGLGFTGITSGSGSGATLGYSIVGGNTIIVDDDSDFSIQLTGSFATLTASDFIFS